MKLHRRIATAGYAAALGLTGYDLALLIAAGVARRAASGPVNPANARSRGVPAAFTVVVVIPAHNESSHIRSAIQSARDAAAVVHFRVRVVVLGHNCTDDTEGRARSVGAEVISIKDGGVGGKGQALEVGLREVVSDPRRVDGV